MCSKREEEDGMLASELSAREEELQRHRKKVEAGDALYAQQVEEKLTQLEARERYLIHQVS